MLNKPTISKGYNQHTTDQELLLALKNRDENAIKYIYQSCWPMILQMVKVNSGSTSEAKDLYQESMLGFLEKIWNDNFVLSCKISTFIYSICRNKWLYQLRGRQKFTDINEYTTIEELADESSEHAIELPEDEQIRKHIADLGEPCYSLLIGFYYENMSMEQLAAKLNYKSVNVAKQQKYRCKDRLKKTLSELF
jgi:RNA polymerase sigma factor (sigma-70 family)